jgi:hypothetical protein
MNEQMNESMHFVSIEKGHLGESLRKLDLWKWMLGGRVRDGNTDETDFGVEAGHQVATVTGSPRLENAMKAGSGLREVESKSLAQSGS